ncbi:hypothetical protein N9Y17_00515 [Gammaproteobacteria bacterium]|nr:hypothetical protein [Gammaproteobacteria bacterium]
MTSNDTTDTEFTSSYGLGHFRKIHAISKVDDDELIEHIAQYAQADDKIKQQLIGKISGFQLVVKTPVNSPRIVVSEEQQEQQNTNNQLEAQLDYLIFDQTVCKQPLKDYLQSLKNELQSNEQGEDKEIIGAETVASKQDLVNVEASCNLGSDQNQVLLKKYNVKPIEKTPATTKQAVYDSDGPLCLLGMVIGALGGALSGYAASIKLQSCGYLLPTCLGLSPFSVTMIVMMVSLALLGGWIGSKIFYSQVHHKKELCFPENTVMQPACQARQGTVKYSDIAEFDHKNIHPSHMSPTP